MYFRYLVFGIIFISVFAVGKGGRYMTPYDDDQCESEQEPEPTTPSPYVKCQHCQGSPESKCARMDQTPFGRPCKSNQCYEAFIAYQNGAMPIVQRRCWIKRNDTTEPDFCTWFNNTASKRNSKAKLLYCKPCFSDLCNTNLQFWVPKYFKH